MPFEEIKGNREVADFLKKDMSLNRPSGTYLFIGRRGINMFDWAKSFAKALNCKEVENDYCGECRICRNIDKEIYPDLHIVKASDGGMKVDEARELIRKASISSYEGDKKIFIIEGVNLLRKESANAILKTIEEPSDGNFFILLSNDKNILPTIKSRSAEIVFKPLGREELEVDERLYDFFEGNSEEILGIQNVDYNFSEKVEYKRLAELVADYLETKEIEKKADIIKGIEDFVEKREYISEIAKLDLVDSLEKVLKKNREFLKEILTLFILKVRKEERIESLIELKEKLAYNVNIKLVLYNFILNI